MAALAELRTIIVRLKIDKDTTLPMETMEISEKTDMMSS